MINNFCIPVKNVAIILYFSRKTYNTILGGNMNPFLFNVNHTFMQNLKLVSCFFSYLMLIRCSLLKLLVEIVRNKAIIFEILS